MPFKSSSPDTALNSIVLNHGELPWLSAMTQQFYRQVVDEHYSHAYMLNADKAYGGELQASVMAQAVLCYNPSEQGACGHCKSCQLIAAGSHPDLHLVAPDGHQIKVDQIRQLCSSLSQTAQQGGRRVAVIHQAERLNLAAANALLKTLEEPGQETLIILQVNHGAQLLATIKSRCQALEFTRPNKAQLLSWLGALNIQLPLDKNDKPQDVTWCIGILGGPIALVDSLANGRYQQLLAYRQDWALAAKQGYVSGELSKVSEEQIIDALNVFYLYLRQYVLKNTKTSPFIQAKIISLAGEVMQMCQRLSSMPNVNTTALCQQYIISFRQLILS
nr:DNA polymerase III subunit delta' [Shewanella maritima]